MKSRLIADVTNRSGKFFFGFILVLFAIMYSSTFTDAQAYDDYNILQPQTSDAITVTIEINGTTKGITYGPESVTLENTSSVPWVGDPLSSPASTVGLQNTQTGLTKAQISYADGDTVRIDVSFSGTRAGNYNACLASDSTKCTGTITSTGNGGSGVIKLSEAEGELLPSAASSIAKLKGESGSSCTIPAIGWIVCPVVNFMAWIADGAFVFLSDNFLQTKPQIFTATDSTGTNPTHSAWSTMRNIANIAFVIAFLIIIFSQISSVGISNYGIKKMLPRLVVAAILVNVSYYICQIAVDLSNILGYSLRDLLANLVEVDTSQASAWKKGNLWSGLAVGILGAAVGTAALWGALALLIPALFAAVVALVMILFILVARQAIIILLIVISPLAFVAFLLPNTSAMFTKWRKTFTAMLVLFPIIAVVFGASSLASTILGSTFQVTEGTNEWMGKIIAAVILVVPLFIVPGLLKKSLDAIPMLGQLASKYSGMANGRVGAKFGEAYKNGAYAKGKAMREQAKINYRNRRLAESIDKGGLSKYLAGGVTGLGAAALGKRTPASWRSQTEAVASSARSTVAAAEAKELNEGLQVMDTDVNKVKADGFVNKDGKLSKDTDDYLTGVVRNGSAIQKKAALHYLAKSGRDGVLRSFVGDKQVDQSDLQSAITANAGSLINKAPDLVKPNANIAFNDMTVKSLAGLSNGAASVYMKHLESLRVDAEQAGSTEETRSTYEKAVKAFNSSVVDIANNTTLQSDFSADLGRVLMDSAKATPNLQAAIQPGISYISTNGQEGKIRNPNPISDDSSSPKQQPPTSGTGSTPNLDASGFWKPGEPKKPGEP